MNPRMSTSPVIVCFHISAVNFLNALFRNSVDNLHFCLIGSGNYYFSKAFDFWRGKKHDLIFVLIYD